MVNFENMDISFIFLRKILRKIFLIFALILIDDLSFDLVICDKNSWCSNDAISYGIIKWLW